MRELIQEKDTLFEGYIISRFLIFGSHLGVPAIGGLETNLYKNSFEENNNGSIRN